jgi:glutathione S-transferase
MQLYGISENADTLKCLLTAAEKGVDIESKPVGGTNIGVDAAEYRAMSPFGTVPCLRDMDFVLCGTIAILSYLDDKGFGPSLVPRNGVARALHYQWIHIACATVAPEVEKLLAGNKDDQAVGVLGAAFDALDNQLRTKRYRGDFIVGDFTLADIHWAPYAHFCELTGYGDLISSRDAVNNWWQKVKQHKSTSKENYVAYTVLPSLDEVKGNQLRSVNINA